MSIHFDSVKEAEAYRKEMYEKGISTDIGYDKSVHKFAVNVLGGKKPIDIVIDKRGKGYWNPLSKEIGIVLDNPDRTAHEFGHSENRHITDHNPTFVTKEELKQEIEAWDFALKKGSRDKDEVKNALETYYEGCEGWLKKDGKKMINELSQKYYGENFIKDK